MAKAKAKAKKQTVQTLDQNPRLVITNTVTGGSAANNAGSIEFRVIDRYQDGEKWLIVLADGTTITLSHDSMREVANWHEIAD